MAPGSCVYQNLDRERALLSDEIAGVCGYAFCRVVSVVRIWGALAPHLTRFLVKYKNKNVTGESEGKEKCNQN